MRERYRSKGVGNTIETGGISRAADRRISIKANGFPKGSHRKPRRKAGFSFEAPLCGYKYGSFDLKLDDDQSLVKFKALNLTIDIHLSNLLHGFQDWENGSAAARL